MDGEEGDGLDALAGSRRKKGKSRQINKMLEFTFSWVLGALPRTCLG